MYSIRQIAIAVKGSLIQCTEDTLITQLGYDSRLIMNPSNLLFFAIKGKRHDGHHFIQQLYDRGVRNFILSDTSSLEQPLAEANIIKVANTVHALQRLAAWHRQRFSYPVIGITGSNGKTVVKEWLFQLLNEDYNIVRSPKSYNSQIGVPLSVWQMQEHHTLGIFEAGISQPDEMDALEQIIQPDIGVFTNIGEAHAEGFLNIRQKINEKLKLFARSKILIYRRDYPEITQCITEIKHRLHESEQDQKFRLFTWSTQGDADLKVTAIQKTGTQTTIEGLYQSHVRKITIPFSDEASIENAIHCWAVLLYLKMEDSKISDRMMQLGSVSMRLELKDGINNCSLINDSYNSDIRSLAIALDFLDQQQQHPKKTVILSDILQSGKAVTELYQEVRNLVAERNITRLIGIGPAISQQQALFKLGNGFSSRFYESTEAFLADFSPADFKNEAILLKGARKFEFEKISRHLERKFHKTILEIDLNALIHNLHLFQSLLRPETKIMAMVKASSYGSGSYEIAHVLQYNRVDYLAVAYADEGVELRKAGIALPIMVMNPELRSFETMIRHRLEPDIYSFSVLEKFYAAVAFAGVKEPYPIHVEMDTGMHRLGFTPDALEPLAESLQSKKLLRVVSVFSHLAASDESRHDAFTLRQIHLFSSLSSSLMERLNYPFIRHIANSAAILRFPEAQFDMVRLGIGLYGVDPTGTLQHQLQQVSTLKAHISQIKIVKAGESVGYSRTFIAQREVRIATVGIGYADGVDRRLGNGQGFMLVRGRPAPTVGNICMDLCMIDISDIAEAEEGDEVIVFGKGLPIQEVATRAGTIPYEILTGISSRVQRVYFKE
ncbi:MAG: bifunctional UDP-N-acetylmuramoyl-tripeptide:D-alanyl-D-alanine ligase/alanine racemase [Chitinophagales bacterium]|nr:MAG: bifunctional UDP-N-acetylmuramoyl-tripeptide:D-alanyl-D-alanine ligase/alanine racemase [Chitinophagales bacterium]